MSEMTVDEMLELVETIDKAILPLGYEVITGHEDEEDGTSDIMLVFKHGRFAMFYEVCEVCGKIRIAR